MIFSFFHYFISKFPLKLLQNLTFFGPDFVPYCSPSNFWVRYIKNNEQKHGIAQNSAWEQSQGQKMSNFEAILEEMFL